MCQHEAEMIKSKLDPTVSPCDDFYEYACGNYKPEIPIDKSEVSIFSVLNDLLEEQLNSSLSENTNEKDTQPLRVAKDFYKACIDMSEYPISH